jgi:hypothetical protein
LFHAGSDILAQAADDRFNQSDRHSGLMDVIRNRMTNRAFAPGPPQHPSYKRWKKPLNQIMSWDRFNTDNFLTDEQVDQWVRDMRAKVMYRDESRVD